METLLKDLSFALRMFGKRPGFSAVVVLSLALGIGANSAIFSLVNGILLRPLPGVKSPGELVGLSSRQSGTQFPMGLSYPDYIDVRDHTDAFAGVTAYNQIYASLSDGGRSDLVYGLIVTGNYFSLLGVEAERGRTLGPEDDRNRGAHPVAVISHGLWQRRFGSDPKAIGQDIRLNGHPFTIVGIAPRGFIGAEVMFAPDLWVPMMMHQQIVPSSREPFDHRDMRDFRALARLRPGADLARAREQVGALAARLVKDYGKTNEGVTIDVVPEGEARLEAGLGDVVTIASAVLLGLVGMVLLIACANVSNLLLIQSAARNREICVRLAVGADRRRLVRQLLTESLLLALTGGALGLLLAYWLSNLMSRFKPPSSIPFAFDFSIDHRVLIFTIAVSLLAGLVFGLAPALQASKADLVTPLRGSAGTTSSRRQSFLRSALVVAQVAVSLPLLICASLFLRSLQNARSINLGFKPENVLTLSVDLSLRSYSEPAGRQLFETLEERVRNLPGVRSAAIGGPVPLDFYAQAEKISVPGFDPGPVKEDPEILYSSVRPGYFETIGTRLLAGRLFDQRDRAGSAPVALVNDAMAKHYWPGRSAVGQRILVGGPGGLSCEVVGIVETGKYRILAESDMPYFYRPFEQAYAPRMTLLVKTVKDPSSVVAAVRREVQALDRDLPVFDVRDLDQLIKGRALMPFKVVTTLAGAFGLLGLILATLGLYGVQASSVAQRSREIGLRMAMGAQSSDVLKLVLRKALILTGTGLLIGLAVGLVLARLMSGLLLAVSPTDPVAFGVVLSVLVFAALLATIVPARRAIGMNPADTLRYD